MIFQNVMFAEIIRALCAGSIAIFFLISGFRLISGLIAVDIAYELREKNAAVGMAVMGMFICVGLAVGLSVGLSIH